MLHAQRLQGRPVNLQHTRILHQLGATGAIIHCSVDTSHQLTTSTQHQLWAILAMIHSSVKGMFLYCAVFHLLDRPNRYTLHPRSFQHQLDFSGKHSSLEAVITRGDYSITFPPRSIAR